MIKAPESGIRTPGLCDAQSASAGCSYVLLLFRLDILGDDLIQPAFALQLGQCFVDRFHHRGIALLDGDSVILVGVGLVDDLQACHLFDVLLCGLPVDDDRVDLALCQSLDSFHALCVALDSRIAVVTAPPLISESSLTMMTWVACA